MGSHGKGSGGRSSGAQREILDAIRRIVQVLRESASATERRVGLSAAQLFVLERLNGHSPLSLSELATRTFTHQSSVSVVVSRLVERGLVERRPSALDARRADVSLTNAGRRTVVEAPEAAQNRLLRATDRLSPRKRSLLARALADLVEAMAIAGRPAQMFFEEAGARGRAAVKPGTTRAARAGARPARRSRARAGRR
jgi:DNA-binding MarR family transcriptional regulator